MKKTLQKELKFQSFPNEIIFEANNNIKRNNSIHEHQINDQSAIMQSKGINGFNNTTAAIISTTSTPNKVRSNKSINQQPIDEINFKYLKHVVLKFVTSREYEVRFFS